MEDKRKTITADDIKTYLLKEERKTAIHLPLAIILLCLMWIVPNLLFKVFILDILAAVTFLLGLICVMCSIINIQKIKNNTYFRITTDVLVNKMEHVSCGIWPNNHIVNRLFFKCNKYDFFPKDGCVWVDIYDMDYQAVFDTAFIGDTFTLVETKKSVVLAFNNKLFQFQE